jgi:hypothetical protein
MTNDTDLFAPKPMTLICLQLADRCVHIFIFPSTGEYRRSPRWPLQQPGGSRAGVGARDVGGAKVHGLSARLAQRWCALIPSCLGSTQEAGGTRRGLLAAAHPGHPASHTIRLPPTIGAVKGSGQPRTVVESGTSQGHGGVGQWRPRGGSRPRDRHPVPVPVAGAHAPALQPSQNPQSTGPLQLCGPWRRVERHRT